MSMTSTALYQKANELAGRGQWQDARASYEQAIAQEPQFAEAHNNLGMAFAHLGDGAKALHHFHQAYSIKPVLKDAFANFAHLMMQLSENGYTATIIKDNLAVRDLIGRATTVWPGRLPAEALLNDPAFQETIKNPYLLFYLGAIRLRDAEIEQMLTQMRFALLAAADANEIQPELFAFACALARQCFNNEYVFALSDDEAKQASGLRERVQADLDTGKEIPAHRLAILASYFPLNSLPNAAKLLGMNWPEMLLYLLVQQVQEPQQEREIREKLPQLTPIEDETSRKVREQYEANPYPRWVITSTPERQVSFEEYMTLSFPHAGTRKFKEHIDVLFAGCGTGSVVAGFGQLIANAKILAVDLSLSSLSYAKRMADHYKLKRTEFGQADILKLPSLGRKFDLICSTGVMHHMADPLAAWRGLVSMLSPGGYMHLGFYSELARKEVSEAWDFIKQHGYGKTAGEIRRFRQDVMALPDGTPMKRALTSPDFYSVSDVRDLLFHEHELRVTIPQIKQFLAENKLEFIGWELPTETRKRYVKEFPADPTLTNLDNWQAFEEKFPRTFSQMYKFWVQKAA
ncbi:MAG TPA: methyltransferase domain-containing protein [Xanthobacteraceae bacterium]|nr:methyltransferase domain-containing protein [Xanthobacteraceae bacterium]